MCLYLTLWEKDKCELMDYAFTILKIGKICLDFIHERQDKKSKVIFCKTTRDRRQRYLNLRSNIRGLSIIF